MIINQSNFNLCIAHLFPVIVLCMFVYSRCRRTQLQQSDSYCSRRWLSAPRLRVRTADVWFHLEKKTTIKL